MPFSVTSSVSAREAARSKGTAALGRDVELAEDLARLAARDRLLLVAIEARRFFDDVLEVFFGDFRVHRLHAPRASEFR